MQKTPHIGSWCSELPQMVVKDILIAVSRMPPDQLDNGLGENSYNNT